MRSGRKEKTQNSFWVLSSFFLFMLDPAKERITLFFFRQAGTLGNTVCVPTPSHEDKNCNNKAGNELRAGWPLQMQTKHLPKVMRLLNALLKLSIEKKKIKKDNREKDRSASQDTVLVPFFF